jgi:hypothetical protein
VIAQRVDAADEARVVDAEIEQPLGDAAERAAHVAEVTARIGRGPLRHERRRPAWRRHEAPPRLGARRRIAGTLLRPAKRSAAVW